MTRSNSAAATDALTLAKTRTACRSQERFFVADNDSAGLEIPGYMQERYFWAYINPRNVRLLDREFVVASVLWRQHKRLQQAAFQEISPGQRVLQPACVYGNFSADLARHIEPDGCLEVTDIAGIQVERCRRKLRDFPWATVRRANALHPSDQWFDRVCCYFLLHEMPDRYRHGVMDALLDRLAPGGKLIVVDYHRPHWAHPLKGIVSLVFATLEPFAKGLWHHEVSDFTSNAERYEWRKETLFGGMFQKVIAVRR